MKKIRISIFAVVISVIILTVAVAAQTPAYVGAEKCAFCHKTDSQGRQYPIWQSIRHSKSFANLTTPQAAQTGQSLGVAKPAEDPQCLKCHGPLAEIAPDFKAEGVTCEVCHGPGSDYKKLSVMKNREEAIKNGLLYRGNPDKIKAFCLKCHENPHGKSFDFAAAWEKIKHPRPAK